MISKVELFEMASEWMRSANGSLRDRKWIPAVQGAGHAIELMLKLRVCVDNSLAGFASDRAEAKTSGQGQFFEHDLETLLSFTKLSGHIKTKHASDWGACIQWNANTKYQPMGSQTKKSAAELLRAANAIMQALQDDQEISQIAYQATVNPYFKLVEVEKQLREEKGAFKLFVVCHRQDSFENTADVVVSAAPWIDPQTREGVQDIEDKILAVLGEDERVNRISAVIALSENNPIAKGFASGTVRSQGGFVTFNNCKFNDFWVDNYTIITVAD